MTDDIVARLREEGFVTHMARLPRESKILHAAADEIERLRAERDDARREICIRSAGFIRADRWMKTPKKVAHWSEEDVALSRGWDCFNEVNQ
jgi:hypothetical protein